jgi:hypothetical protein
LPLRDVFERMNAAEFNQSQILNSKIVLDDSKPESWFTFNNIARCFVKEVSGNNKFNIKMERVGDIKYQLTIESGKKYKFLIQHTALHSEIISVYIDNDKVIDHNSKLIDAKSRC